MSPKQLREIADKLDEVGSFVASSQVSKLAQDIDDPTKAEILRRALSDILTAERAIRVIAETRS